MKTSTVLPNLFTYLVFTRLVGLTVSEKMQSRYTEATLEKYLENNFIKIKDSSSAIHKKLQQTDKVHIYLTDAILNNLIEIYNNEDLKDWEAIQKFIEDEIDLSNHLSTYEFFKKHTKQIIKLEKINDLIGLSEYLEENRGPSVKEILNGITSRALELAELSPIHVLGKHISIDEYNVLLLLNLFMNEISKEWLRLIENCFDKRVFNFRQCIHLLNKKGLLSYSGDQLILKSKLPNDISIENIKHLKETLLGIQSLINQTFINSLDISKFIYLLQSLDLFYEAGLLLEKHFGLIKHSGRFRQFSTILYRQIEFESKNGIIDPWDLWSYSNCHLFMGNVKESIEAFSKLISYFNKYCREGKSIKKEYIELYFKSFQLGLNIALIGDNNEVLANQIESVRYFTVQYLLNRKVYNEVTPNVRIQTLLTLGIYLSKVGYESTARDILTNLKEEFIGRELTLTKADIILNYLKLFDDHLTPVKLGLIREAYVCFKAKRSNLGLFSTALLRAKIEENNLIKEKALFRALKYYSVIDGYYPHALEILESILPNLQDESLVAKCSLAIDELKLRKSAIKNEIVYFPTMSIIMEKDLISKTLGEDKNNTSFSLENIKSIIKEISTPIYRNQLAFHSADVQKLINGSVKSKHQFLLNTIKKSGYDYQSFYLNTTVKFVLTKSLTERQEYEYLLNTYFSDERIDDIKKLRNFNFIIDYARSLSRINPKSSKKLLDKIPYNLRDAEYYSLLGNYYTSLGTNFYTVANEAYLKAIELCELTNWKVLARIKTSFGFHLVQSIGYEPRMSKWGERLFWEAISISGSPYNFAYPYLGILYIRLVKNQKRVNERFVQQQLDYLKLSVDEKILILEKMLLGDKKFLIKEYSTIYRVLKQYEKYKEKQNI